MNMYMIVANTNNSTDILSNVVEFTYKVGMFPMSSEFKAVIRRPSYYDTYKSVRVFLDSKILFMGSVIKQTDKLGQDGGYLELVCNGHEMNLLENQVRPRTMENCSSTTIYTNYGSAYGLLSNGLISTTIPQLTITAGMSAWNVIDMFCRQAYNSLPLVTREGELTTNLISDNNYTIGNNGTDHPYTSLRYIDDRSKMLSRIYRKDPDSDSYPSYHDYSIASTYGVTRERYYTMPTAWEPYPDVAVSQVLRNAALDSLEVEITLPELLTAYPSDYVTFNDDFFSEKNYYVSNVSMVCNSQGYYTTLRLWSMMRY